MTRQSRPLNPTPGLGFTLLATALLVFGAAPGLSAGTPSPARTMQRGETRGPGGLGAEFPGHTMDADAAWKMTLRDHRDRVTSLSEEASDGALVVVVLKGASCPVCVGQLKRLADLKARLDRLGATVVGLAVEKPVPLSKLVRDHKLPFTLLSDQDKRVVKSLRLWVESWKHPLPSIVVFDRCGQEVSRQEGRNSQTRPEVALLKLLKSMSQKPARCPHPTSR